MWRSRLRIKSTGVMASAFPKSGVPDYAVSRLGEVVCLRLFNERWRPRLRIKSLQLTRSTLVKGGVPDYALSRSGVACCICLSFALWCVQLRIKSIHVTASAFVKNRVFRLRIKSFRHGLLPLLVLRNVAFSTHQVVACHGGHLCERWRSRLRIKSFRHGLLPLLVLRNVAFPATH